METAAAVMSGGGNIDDPDQMLATTSRCARPGCENKNATKYCGNCENVMYCSGECQRLHWKVHKPDCEEKKNTDPLICFSDAWLQTNDLMKKADEEIALKDEAKAIKTLKQALAFAEHQFGKPELEKMSRIREGSNDLISSWEVDNMLMRMCSKLGDLNKNLGSADGLRNAEVFYLKARKWVEVWRKRMDGRVNGERLVPFDPSQDNLILQNLARTELSIVHTLLAQGDVPKAEKHAAYCLKFSSRVQESLCSTSTTNPLYDSITAAIQICEINQQFRDVALLSEQGYAYALGVHGHSHKRSQTMAEVLIKNLMLVEDYAIAERYARKHYEALLLHAQTRQQARVTSRNTAGGGATTATTTAATAKDSTTTTGPNANSDAIASSSSSAAASFAAAVSGAGIVTTGGAGGGGGGTTPSGDMSKYQGSTAFQALAYEKEQEDLARAARLYAEAVYARYVETGSDDTSLGLTPAGTSHYRQLREKEKEKEKEKAKEKEKEEGKDSLVVGGSPGQLTVDSATTGGVAGSSVVAGAGGAVSTSTSTPGASPGPSPGPVVTTHNPGPGAHAAEIAGVEVTVGVDEEPDRPLMKIQEAEQLAKCALRTMETVCKHSIGEACMGPFVDTYASILLARRKLDAGTRQCLERFLAVSLRHEGNDGMNTMKASDKLGTYYYLIAYTLPVNGQPVQLSQADVVLTSRADAFYRSKCFYDEALRISVRIYGTQHANTTICEQRRDDAVASHQQACAQSQHQHISLSFSDGTTMTTPNNNNTTTNAPSSSRKSITITATAVPQSGPDDANKTTMSSTTNNNNLVGEIEVDNHKYVVTVD